VASYVIRVRCIECGRWWSKRVEVETDNPLAEALEFLRDRISYHGHGVEGEWNLTWELVK